MKKIIFYNRAHYGDLFVSRSFIKDICNTLTDNKYRYIHKYHSNYLFNDIKLNESKLDNNLDLTCDYFIDTWYDAHNSKYYKETGCTLQTLYKLFTEAYQELQIPIKNIRHYIPEIDFNFYNLKQEKRNKDTVLICNNTPLSGQSSTEDMTDFIEKLAVVMPNKTFLITNDTLKPLNYKNVFYTKNILKENNLIELSWLSTQCSSVIGRSSGPYTFCLTKTNLEQELKFFEIVYSDPEVNFKNSNFGLDNLNYNNFYNICAKNTWDEILLFLEKYHDNL